MMYSRLATCSLLTMTCSALVLLAAEPTVPSVLQPPQYLPGPVAAYNILGDRRGNYHDPVTENGLSPGVLVFVRQLDKADSPVVKFLKSLNDLSKNTTAYRIGVAAVYMNDDGYEHILGSKVDDKTYVTDLPLTKAIVYKQKKVADLTQLGDDAKLDSIELSMGTTAGPAGYQLPKDADVTIIAYFKLRILKSYVFGQNQFTSEAADRVFNDIRATITHLDQPLQGRP